MTDEETDEGMRGVEGGIVVTIREFQTQAAIKRWGGGMLAGLFEEKQGGLRSHIE